VSNGLPKAFAADARCAEAREAGKSVSGQSLIYYGRSAGVAERFNLFAVSHRAGRLLPEFVYLRSCLAGPSRPLWQVGRHVAQ